MSFPRPGINKSYALGRLPAGQMNKLEASYAALLEARKAAGEIIWFSFEMVTLKLAADTRYTPDFALLLANGELEFHETKGGWVSDDGLVKWKVAAQLFPARFLWVTAIPKKEGGGWKIKEYGV